MKPTLSIVVPILNEASTLPRFFSHLERCCAEVAFPIECIVVDGGSHDPSLQICQDHAISVISARRGRGYQLAEGARRAAGEVLLFLHVDCALTPEHCRVAVRLCQEEDIVAGGFRLAFDERHPILQLAERVNLVRFRVTRVFYGDHGLFLRREIYERAGGMPEQALFEDVAFSKRLRKLGRVVLASPPMVTSARRFRRGGIVRTYLKMACLHVLYGLGVSPDRLAGIYDGRARC